MCCGWIDAGANADQKALQAAVAAHDVLAIAFDHHDPCLAGTDDFDLYLF